MTEEAPQIMDGQPCTFCGQKTLSLIEQKREVPYFGNVFLFSMSCSTCKYHKSDVNAAEEHDPVKFTLEISSEEDMNIRIVKSSEATVKVPHIMTMEAGDVANGYITNVEGILNRMKHALEIARDAADDSSDKNKAKNMLKKLGKVMWGQEKIKMILEDPTGNSAIISDKAVKEKLKVKKKK